MSNCRNSIADVAPTTGGLWGACAMRGGRRYRGGFTLIEILLAVTILALVITAVYRTWSGALIAWKRGSSVADTLQRQRIVMDTLAELAHSAVFFGPNIDLYQIESDHKMDLGDTISFVTASDALLPPSEIMYAGMRRVTIGLERDQSGRA